MKEDVAIRLENVSKTFSIRDKVPGNILRQGISFVTGNNKRRIEAVKNVSLEVKKGEFIGIIGTNGSGKSTLVHLMTGVYRSDKGSGKAEINGSFIRLSLGMGFNRQLTARENVYLNGSLMGIKIRTLNERFDKIIEFAELQKFVNTKLKYFSRGMKARLAFAIAVHTEAEIILMDEFFGGVGDEKFKARSDEIFKEAFINGRTIVHVSHNLRTIKEYADRAVLLHEGRCLGIGPPAEILDLYKKTIRVDKLSMREE